MAVRVLVVEDVKASHELILEVLQVVGGFRVLGVCATEGSALQWLHDHHGACDLVILDLVLREGSGFTVLNALIGPEQPDILVFSDFATPAVAAKCLGLGAIDAIPKSDYRSLRNFLEQYRGTLAEAA